MKYKVGDKIKDIFGCFGTIFKITSEHIIVKDENTTGYYPIENHEKIISLFDDNIHKHIMQKYIGITQVYNYCECGYKG